MINIDDKTRRLSQATIVVGYKQENRAESIEFKIPEYLKEYGKKICFKTKDGKVFSKLFDNTTSNIFTFTRTETQYGELDATIQFFKTENEDMIIYKTSMLHIIFNESIICEDEVQPDEPKIPILESLIEKVTDLNNTITENEETRNNNENIRISNENERKTNEKERETYYTNIQNKVNAGELNGATYLPNVDAEGNISWTNNKGLENPSSQNIRGPQGVAGPQGEAFKIKKTYSSVEAMQADLNNMQVGDYVMITSSVEVEDNAKLYARTETEWVFITDFSGATGIQGEQGPQGIQGIQGERGIGISKLEVIDGSLWVTLTDSTTQNAGLIITDEVKQWIVNQVTDNAKSDFNTYYDGKVTDFDNHVTEKTNEFNTNATDKTNEFNQNAESLKVKIEELKNQIPSGTASGNSIHLEDSSNMDFEWKLRSESRQETTEGYNLLNVENDFKVTNLEANKVVEINLKADVTYTIKCDKIETDNTELKSCLFRFQHDSADVANPYARIPITTKTTTYTPPEDINSVRIYSGTSHNESATTNTTFKNLMIYEGTAEKSYEPYTGGTPSPNPNYPQKIQNVGDNINVLNKDTVDASNNLRGNALDTGRRLIANKDGTYIFGVFKLGGRELLGKTLGIHADIETTGGNPRISIFAGNSSSITKSLLQVVLSASGTGYMTIPSNLNSELDTISAVLYVTTDASVVAGTYVDYTNLKVQVGSEEVVYSAYNCGSLGVTIRNENFGDAELLYSQMKNFSSSNVRKELVDNKNCIVFNNTSFRGGLGFEGLKFKYKENTRYVIRGKFRIYDTTITSGAALYMQAIDLEGNYIGIISHQAEGSEWIQFSFATNANSTLSSINFSYGVQGLWCLDMDSLEIYEGNTVREVPKSQVQTIIFPLAEGQKLYEGSYLAEDGIHNKRPQKEFSGAKEERFEINTNYSTESMLVAQILVNDMKTGTQNIISNYFSYNSIIKIGTIRAAGNYLLFGLDKSTFPDIETFKTFLAQKKAEENSVLAEYELAEEEIIPYTEAQQAVTNEKLYTYKNVTNISVDDELATLDITYKKDLETMFNNIIKQIPSSTSDTAET